MKKNIGGVDRIIRLTVAAILAGIFVSGVVHGLLAYVLLGVAGVFLLTSLFSFCPLYRIVGLNTCKLKNN